MFKIAKKDHLELVCPKCDKNTKVKTENGVQCSCCNEPFNGLTFKRKKFLSRAAGILLVSGAITGVALEDAIEDGRLAYESEYTLMTACMNLDGVKYSRRQLADRIELCACSVREAVNKLGIDSNSDDEDEVVGAFLNDVNATLRSCE